MAAAILRWPPDPFELSGRYVRLIPMRVDHAAALAACAALDRAAYGFTAVPDGVDEAAAYITKALDDRARGVSVPFVQVDARSTEVIGSTRFLNIERWDAEHGSGNGLPDVAEIGSTWLAGPAQRTAVNTEAKLLLMTHAFDVWGVLRLWIKTDAANVRSRAAIERLGVTFEGVLRHFQPAQGRPGPRDTASYSVLPDEWPVVRSRLESMLAR
jgi:RimJ/RimL family protein N-acetyltransferase